ncbi:type I restriction endonuclease subunit R, EcoR124 family [Thiothrix fructosivorans]
MDFELALMHRDEINVAYILNLLREIAKIKGETTEPRHNAVKPSSTL